MSAYTHMASNTTVQVTDAPCTLRSVCVNTKGASSNILTLSEGILSAGAVPATATTIAIIDTTANVGSIIFDVIVSNGIIAVLGTGTAADITITTQ